MLDEVGHLLPHGWIAGDDEMGRSSSFRRELRCRSERYLLAVPSNTLIRDLEGALPEQEGPGPTRKAPFLRADKWRALLPGSAWTRLEEQFKANEVDVVRVVTARTNFFNARRAALDTLNELAQASANLLAATGLPPEALIAPLAPRGR